MADAYENYVAVVIGREYLAYFKPKGIYTWYYYFPYTIGSGFSVVYAPLFYILDFVSEAEEKDWVCAVLTLYSCRKIRQNTHQKGSLKKKSQRIEPGKHILYTPGMKDPTAIIPIQFNAQPLTLFQEATKQLQKEIGGIDSGQLSVKSEALTEEEVKRIAQSENLIPNMIISGIMLHIVSKYSERLCSNL